MKIALNLTGYARLKIAITVEKLNIGGIRMNYSEIEVKITPRMLISLTTGEKVSFIDGSTKIVLSMEDE